MPVGAGRARDQRLISIPPLTTPSCNPAATSLCCAEPITTLPPLLVTCSCRTPAAAGTSTITAPVIPEAASRLLIAVCMLAMKPGRSAPCAKVTGIAGCPSTAIEMLRLFAALFPKRCAMAVNTSALAAGKMSPEIDTPGTPATIAATPASTCAETSSEALLTTVSINRPDAGFMLRSVNVSSPSRVTVPVGPTRRR